MKAGTYRLELQGVRAEDGFQLLRVTGGAARNGNLITVRDGETIENLTVVAGYGDGSLRGKIEIAGGVTMFAETDGIVWLKPLDFANGQEYLSHFVADGSFAFKNLLPGLYELRVVSQGHELAPGVCGTENRKIQIAPGENQITVTLTANKPQK